MRGALRPAWTDREPQAGFRPNVQTGGNLWWALQTDGDESGSSSAAPASVPRGQDGSTYGAGREPSPAAACGTGTRLSTGLK